MQNLEQQIAHDYFIDAKELFCPEPIMLLHQKINAVEYGSKILLATKDKAAIADVKNFTKHLKHQLLEQNIENEILYFLIEKC